MSNLQVARLRQFNEVFMVVYVNWHTVANSNSADEVINYLYDRLRVPIYLYSLNGKMIKVRGAKRHLNSWLLTLHPSQIPWRQMALN